jgi:CelD/BcsL family acetyltransferase involved in cellulose biosynthesis
MYGDESETIRDTGGTSPPNGTVTIEPLHYLERYWQDSGSLLQWDCLFMLPQWLGVWWSYFGRGSNTHLYVVRQHDTPIGVAPLTVSGDTAALIGHSDLIDYSDFIVATSREQEFFSILFDHLRREGVHHLDMGRIRADSPAVSRLAECSPSLGCDISYKPVDVLYEMELPDTWEGYLARLSGGERHETRRKIRRLEGAGTVRLRVIEGKEDTLAAMETFVGLFRSNVKEKAQFMAGAVEPFFRSLAVSMADAGFLKLFFLDLDGIPAAGVMCFDYRSTVYLYNNGYDLQFRHLSVGILSKVFSIRESIVRGRTKYNFLRGMETYKRHLGGQPVTLYHCGVIIK